MKRSLIFLALAGLAWHAPVATAAAPTELSAALALKGDPGQGRTAYEICCGCHNRDGSGRAEAGYPRLAGQHATVLIKQMTDIRSGQRQNPKMHPFVDKDVVPVEDIAHIAAYLAGLPEPGGNGKGDGRRLPRGKALYERDCATCHGGNGAGNAERFIPRVAGQHYGYLLRASKAIQAATGNRRGADPGMVQAIKGYGYLDIAAVSDYMSRLSPSAP